MMEYPGKRVTVAGLGHFGGNIATARWLVGQGASVLVTDSAPADKLADSIAQLQGLDLLWRLGEHRVEDFTSAAAIVASPALPPWHPCLMAARQAGVPITTEIRLFIERCPAPIIAVTGTKGKSTTTQLLHLMLSQRHTTHVGGNLGGSLLGILDRIQPTDRVILELSSYMLHHLREIRWSPSMAVVTMLAADHLKWHGSREEYLKAKRTIVEFQADNDHAVLNDECSGCRDFATEARGRLTWFGVEGRRPFELRIPGRHNQLNAQAAFAAAQLFGISWDEAQKAISGFAGLPHRLQLVHEANGVRYINDSIATIPEAAIAALESFPLRKVIQIVGGEEHDLPIEDLCDALRNRAKAVLCIGQSASTLMAELTKPTGDHTAALYDCGDLPTAIKAAKAIARSGDIVLLSTGFKSFGQFAHFEERGCTFALLACQS